MRESESERERESGFRLIWGAEGFRLFEASGLVGAKMMGFRTAELRVDAQSYMAGIVLVPQHALEVSFGRSRAVKTECSCLDRWFRSLSHVLQTS